MSVRDILRAWDRFFFEPTSPLPIAVYRVLLGTLILANQLLMAPDVAAWFGPRGVVSFETARQVSGGGGFSFFWFLPQNSFFVWLIFAASCLLAVALAIGFFTRTSAILLFLTLLTLQHRNPLTLNSGDTFLRIATFFIIFSPAGKALSFDRWRQVKNGDLLATTERYSPWAMRLIQLQLSFLYVYAFVWKAMGPTWLSGTAVYYTSRLVEFWRFPVPYVFEHTWTIKLWSWCTLLIEFALGTLIWVKEFRYPVLIAGILLHAGIDYSMNIPLFGFIMVSTYVTFIDPTHLEKVLRRFVLPGHWQAPAPLQGGAIQS